MMMFAQYNSAFFESLNYKLDAHQARFTMGIEAWVDPSFSPPSGNIIVIMFDDRPAGFFVLDRGADKLQLTGNESSVLLRSFSVNPDYQGKGIGKWAMRSVDEYVKRQMPDVEEIVLSVNLENTLAYRLYIGAGFTDTGKTINGIAGPQHVLSKYL